jgi:hypothetical protein
MRCPRNNQPLRLPRLWTQVNDLEQMTETEKEAFWQEELDRVYGHWEREYDRD